MQSEQTRQSKREQKRLRREEKRRSSGVPLGGKVGAALRCGNLALLLNYAGPLIDAVPQGAGGDKLAGDLLLFAAVVWNSVVQQNGDADEAARKLIADMKSKVLFPPPDALVEWLARPRRPGSAAILG